MYRSLSFLALVAGISGSTLLGQSAPSLRVLPLGDSLTAGISVPTYGNGYRPPLYDLLQNSGYQVDFLGTEIGPADAALPELEHEGHSGFRIQQIDTGLAGWLNTLDEPDVVLLLIGTNDFSPGQPDQDTARFRLETLIGNIAILRPHAAIIVANLPLRTDDAGADNAIQTLYNPYIPGIVAAQAGLGRHVTFLDLRSLLVAGDLSFDGVHPNASGYNKIASAWRSAIAAIASPNGTAVAPAILRVRPQVDLKQVSVTFTKPLEDAAANPAFFSLTGGATVLQATLDAATKRTITLTTSMQATNSSYTLTVTGVRDRTSAHLPVAPGTAVTFQSGAVAEAGAYSQVFGIELPDLADFRSTDPLYSFDNHASVDAFDRVAYYLELQQGAGSPQYVWASMNAFTTDSGKLGIPTVQSGAFFQRSVASLNVRSNVASVTSGDGFGGGRLEFWPNDYSSENSAGVPGASSTVFDAGDRPAEGPPGHGSMQLHNTMTGQTLFAYNGWGGTGLFADIGIGNRASLHTDWTLAQNAGNYTRRNLQVYVLDSTPPAGVPFITGQPSSRAVQAGTSAIFSVTATGPAPLSYQWRFNQSPIPGATGSSHTIANAQLSHAGNYDVVVSDGTTPVTSTLARLVVSAPGSIANGSFEADYTGWMAVGNQLITGRATDGANGVSLNGGNAVPDGTLVQSFSTVPGQTYVLRLDVGAFGATNSEQRLRVFVFGEDLLVARTISRYASGGSTAVWQQASCSFVADGPTTTLALLDVSPSTSGVDLLLDNVRLTASAPITPVVANGSFENGYAGWAFVGNQGVSSLERYDTPDGQNAVVFSPGSLTPNGVLAQTISTTPGQAYVLEFDAGVYGFSTGQQRLQVTIAGSGTLVSDTVVISGVGGGNTRWMARSYVFVANSSSTTMTFRDISSVVPNADLLLDNVRVLSLPIRTLSVTSSPDSGVSISVSPADVNGLANGTTSFNRSYDDGMIVNLNAPATASGRAFLKWQRDGSDYSSTPGISVTLNANIALNAIYASDAPTIASAPENLTATVGSTAAFTVGASGTAPLTYQWRFNDIAIPGASQATYSFGDVQPEDAGNYDVVVSNDGGSTTSAAAILTVPGSGVLANGSFESSYDGWTPTGNQGFGGGGATDGLKSVSFNWGETTPNGVLVQRFTTSPGQTYTLSFDAGAYGGNTNEQRIQAIVHGSTTLLSPTVSVFGIGGGKTRWVSASYLFVANSGITTLRFRDLSTRTASIDLKLDNVRISVQATRTLSVETTPDSAVTITVSPADLGGATNGATPFARAYDDGTQVTLIAPTTAAGKAFQKWQLNGVDYSTNPSTTVTLDANRTLRAVYIEGAPIVTSSPTNLTAGVGSTVTFSVTATGTAPLTYQWRLDGVDISGASLASYTLTDVATEDAGSYDVVVSNGGGSTTSAAALLTVPASGVLANGSFESDYEAWTPTGNQGIGGRPSDGTKGVSFNWSNTSPNGVLVQRFATTPGQTYLLAFDMGVYGSNTNLQRLQVTVQGTGTLLSTTESLAGLGGGATRWVAKSFSFVANSATTTLTFRDVSTTTNSIDLLLDHVRVTTEATWTLSIESTPDTGVAITVSPNDVGGAGNGNTPFARQYNADTVVSLTAPASAAGKAFQKWQLNGADHSTNPSTNVTLGANHTLRAVYIEGAPIITSSPANMTAGVGSTALFNVTATGTAPLTYQWRLDGADISGANLTSYTLTDVATEDAGSYDVVVSNGGGSTTSTAAVLTVPVSGVLANGSFESDYEAWTPTGNQGVGGRANDGTKGVSFNWSNTSPNGVLVQRFTTTPGQTYLLAFDMGVFGYSTNLQRLQVTVQGAGTLLSTTESLAGLGGGATRWVAKSFSFVANSATTTLTFRDVSTTTNSIDLLLDHVRVTTGL